MSVPLHHLHVFELQYFNVLLRVTQGQHRSCFMRPICAATQVSTFEKQ